MYRRSTACISWGSRSRPLEKRAEYWEPGGLFLASTPSRHHDPELADVVPWAGTKGTFDAEEASELVSSVFDDVKGPSGGRCEPISCPTGKQWLIT